MVLNIQDRATIPEQNQFINKRWELINRCRHQNRYLLSQFAPNKEEEEGEEEEMNEILK